jgi:hypothetical protein
VSDSEIISGGTQPGERTGMRYVQEITGAGVELPAM